MRFNNRDFDKATNMLRSFFRDIKGYKEVHTQNELSILAACEDPQTIATYDYNGELWPLPQTGQMWLENYLLTYPEEKGFFCVSTSYRNEPNPVEGRHDKIFPMFEFELKGGMGELRKVEMELLDYLGFNMAEDENIRLELNYPRGDYDDICKKYGVDELEHEHEEQIEKDFGRAFFLENFPERTSPFWNMKLNEDKVHSNKIDVIIHGIETIGSAERSTNKEEMREKFKTISDGGYANILYSKFSKERVEAELDKFLEYDFFERSGGGIDMTRMIRALKLSNLL